MSSYPKALYHSTKEPVLVADEAAHKALGAGWFESPAEAKLPTKKEVEEIAKKDAETIAVLSEDLVKASDDSKHHHKKAK